MAKHSTRLLGDVLSEFIQGTELETHLVQEQIVLLWPQIMGPTVAGMTTEIVFKNGQLILHIHNAALRQQLFECRFDVIKKLNDAIGCPHIKDIRLLA